MNAIAPQSEPGPQQRWMSILAKSNEQKLADAWKNLEKKPEYDFLRRPETGLIMVRGRAGGVGEKFNLGEMTMTRCSIQLANGQVGHGYVMGRGTRHAELAALFDALMQDPAYSDALETNLIRPLEHDLHTRKTKAVRDAEATKVEFFTMVRGEDDE